MKREVKLIGKSLLAPMGENLEREDYMLVTPEEADALVASILKEASSPPPARNPKHEGWVFNQAIRDFITGERTKFFNK
jgi:hypothetical protein